MVPAARGAPGAARRVLALAADRRRARAARRAARRARPARGGRGRDAGRGRLLAELRRRGLQPRAQGGRPDRHEGARAAGRDGRPGVLRRPQPHAGARRRCRGRDPRRRRPPRGGLGHLSGRPGGRTPPAARRAPACRAGAGHRRADHVQPGAHGPGRRDRCPRARHLPALRPERDPRRRWRQAGRSRRARGSRPSRRSRPFARPGEGDHERQRRDLRGGDSSRRAAATACRRRADRRPARQPTGRRRHPQRRPGRARPRSRAGRGARSVTGRGAGCARAATAGLRGGRGRVRALRGRLPRRRHRPGHPARGAELRRRHRGRGRRDRACHGSGRGARRPRPPAREVRHRGRALR